jgi:hypothetical protein
MSGSVWMPQRDAATVTCIAQASGIIVIAFSLSEGSASDPTGCAGPS